MGRFLQYLFDMLYRLNFKIFCPDVLQGFLRIGKGLIVLGFCSSVLQAQTVKSIHIADRFTHTTLFGWDREMRTILSDRFHSREGFVTDRGAFQYFVPGMDEEYHLDLFTYKFTPQEDYQWMKQNNGMRTYVGSVNVVNFATVTEIKNRVNLAEKHQFNIHATQEDNLQASRMFVELEYRFQLKENQWVGFEQTAGGFKPDLDINLFYQRGTMGNWMARVDFTFLDYANNFIFDGLGAGSRVADVARIYNSTPKLVGFQLATPHIFNNFRGELVGGFQTEADADIGRLAFNEDEEIEVAEDFNEKQRNNYLGVLLEYNRSFLTIGAQFRRNFSTTERDSIPGTEIKVDYESEQTLRRTTLFLLANSQDLSWQTWINFQRYEDLQEGERFDIATIRDSLNFREKRIMLRNRIQWRPTHKGLILGLEHLLDFRDFLDDDSDQEILPDFQIFKNFLASDDSGLSAIHDINSRLNIIFGYQLSPNAKIEAGLGFDIDDDLNSKAESGGQRFDNGFGRIFLSW